MTDREMLEWAALAVGEEVWTDIDGNIYTGEPERRWNPFRDDGDAFRLAVRLKIGIVNFPDTVVKSCAVGWKVGPAHCSLWEPEGDDPYAATRRAITRAAAAIGEQKGKGL